nr:PREDICTED: ATPase family AAA domain-containing protein 2-like isoform X2 [Bemisia tabaci]
MPVRNGLISESQSDDDDDDDEGIFTKIERPRRQRESRMMVSPREPIPSTSRNRTNSTERSLQDSQEGIRRSTRQRKLKYENYSDSWIVGAQTLRGYPMYNTRGEAYSQDLSEQASRSPKQPDETEDGETEDNEEVEEEKRQVLERPRRNLRKVKEGDDSSDKLKNGTEENNKEETANGTGIFDQDMYSRVKSRRPRQATIYTVPTRSSLRQRNIQQQDAGSSGDEPSSSSDEEEEEVETKRVSRRVSRPMRETRSVDVVMTERSSGIKYHLRKTKPVVKPFQLQPAPANRRSSRVLRVLCDTVRRRRRRRSTSSSSDSSSSSAMSHAGHSKVPGRGRQTKARKGLDKSMRGGGGSGKVMDGKTGLVHGGKAGRLADIDPVTLDTSIRFEHVGGLENHVRCLQEMVVFPMLYTEIFKKFNVKPPKGVLFHGPPGTGKTLLARALANECSQGQRKVSFFMRKGADCLCKWVGESERQLRLLFEQAYEMRPSIIFFDELDGLAPVRSSKQDQIHASIVSTLLALMDGLTDRGEIIVIGATNRIDAIDPALRRPGRFDRELYFPLPAKKERQEILRIHVDKWEQPPSPELLDYLAEQTSGYCGSDLRSLCSEAVIQALRRRYPQIYKSSLKLLLNPDNVKVEKLDFEKALQSIVSASSRVTIKPGRKLPSFIEPLLKSSLEDLIRHTQKIFPHCTNQDVLGLRLVHSPRLLITGSKVHINLLTSGLLHHIEHCPVHTLDVSCLFSVSARAPEEAIIQIFSEMRRLLPCVLFIPEVNEFWDVIQPSVKAVLLSQIYNLDCTSPLLIVATSSSKKVSHEIRKLFNSYQGDIFATSNPDSKARENFFRPLLLERALKPPPKPKFEEEQLEELPVAPPPSPPKLTESQLKDLYDKEENTLRELRIFLRQICTKLANNKQFFMFTKPVDIEEVPDYLQIIQQPMDLETMMTKIDLHRYTCAQDFLNDIDLLVRNALEYNPDRDPADKLVRHRACYLRDTAYALIKAEMDSDFEEQCKSIRGARQQREKVESSVHVAESFVPEFVHTKPVTETHPALAPSWYQKDAVNKKENGPHANATNTYNSSNVRRRKRRTSLWAKGIAAKRKKIVKSEPSANETENSPGTPPSKKLSGSNTNLAKKNSCSPTSPAVSAVENSMTTPARYPTKAERKEPCQMATSTPIHITHRTRSSSREHASTEKTAEEPLVNGYNESSDEEMAAKEEKEGTVIDVEESALLSDDDSEDCQSPVLLKKEVNVITVSKTALGLLLSEVVQVTEDVESIEPLIYLYSQFKKIIGLYIKKTDRTNLVQDLQEELQRFVRFFVTREEDPDLNLDESICTILETSTAQQC